MPDTLPTRRSEGAQIVIETIYAIIDQTKQPEPLNNVLFLCERYKLIEEEKQEVLDWLASYNKRVVKGQYANTLKSLHNMEDVLLFLVGKDGGKQAIRDIFHVDVDKEEMDVEVISITDRGKIEVLDKTIPFTSTIQMMLHQEEEVGQQEGSTK